METTSHTDSPPAVPDCPPPEDEPQQVPVPQPDAVPSDDKPVDSSSPQDNTPEVPVTEIVTTAMVPVPLESSLVTKDVEASEKQEKVPYPKSVIFILGNEMCERFCYYGLRAILALYLKNVLDYEGHAATAIVHFFVLMCYFFPVVGAIIADSWLGKFWTILHLSVVYAIGTVVLAVASIESLDIPHRAITWVGLILIAIGTGGIKPCVSAFGGDQFTLPQQAKQLAQFFSLFYFTINLGSCVSQAITPVLRGISCLGQDSCYPISFGLPALLMIVATVLFVLGKPMYRMRKPEGNIFMDVCGCMWFAASNRISQGAGKEKHWLDFAKTKYDDKLITDVKALLSVALIFLPAPFFWAVFDQQSSTWIFQAEKMNGKVGSWTILPEQIQVLNPVLVVILVPLFEFIVYPFLAKCNLITTPLQKFGVGLILSAVSFAMSAGLEAIIQSTDNVHMLWQLPQVLVMTVAEVMFSVQGLNFGFTQAPKDLKAVVTSLWLLTTAFGNLIVVFISGASLFNNMVFEFLFYSLLICVDFFVFLYLAMKYEYKNFD